MNFVRNLLPSSSKESEWYWQQCCSDKLLFSSITIGNQKINFNQPTDYFKLTGELADKIVSIGKPLDFFLQGVYLSDFGVDLFNRISTDSTIGQLLDRIKIKRPTADVHGLYCTYKYMGKSVYCAFTVCFVDKDTGGEMETAVVEISQDEIPFIQPVYVNEEVLDYLSFDDIATISYWLGNLWLGIQYELNNCPEEIRVVERRGPISAKEEPSTKQTQIILVKTVVPVDGNGEVIKYGKTNSGRKYTMPSWGVRGHNRTLPNGRVIPVKSYRKGKDRKKTENLVSKEYKFIEEKIDSDFNKS